ncbi:MAG: DEAD/DEAH box helicase, partial [Dehalococcoidia bacterium]
VVVERFRDELGDWRVVILTPFGGRVHAPWSQAIEATLSDGSGFDVQTLWSDDGIAIRFAGGDELPGDASLFPSGDEVEDMVIGRLADTPMFAAHFRECAGRALLLPKRRPGVRSPLWQQRQRSSNLMAVASRYGSFPIVLETYRECLQDVFDLPGLREILQGIHDRSIRVVSVETPSASPFARSLLFDYIAAYMYEGDAPLAERRAQALALDRTLLRDLLGEDELRELLDADAMHALELDLQGLSDERKARNADQVHDLLRRVGDLAELDVTQRVREPESAAAWLQELERSHRACRVRIAGEERWIPAEDAGRYRDALGVAPPLGVPEPFLGVTIDALDGLAARYARVHAPFVARDPAGRWAIPEGLVRDALTRLERTGGIVHGNFRPGGTEREWADADVLRQLRRRSLARLRSEVEPVDGPAFARFLAAWQGIPRHGGGVERLRAAVRQIEGLPIPASVLEADVLPARVPDYQQRLLDELGASGEVGWVGHGSLGRDDGRVAIYRRENLPHAGGRTASLPNEQDATVVLECLRQRGASFFVDIVRDTGLPHREALAALWELVWDGQVTNDTFAPVRALAYPRRKDRGPRRNGSPIPPEATGRWWALPIEPSVAPTLHVHGLVERLLDRYGVLTRDAVSAEGVPGGFSAVYPMLKAMEESGRIRRGYFVEGLSGAQFALPAAVERLRAQRSRADAPATFALAATDPANPYGTMLPWPRSPDADSRRAPARAAGARVVLVDGEAVLYVERGGKGLLSFPAIDDSSSRCLALSTVFEGAEISIERIDGLPAVESPLAGHLLDAGFRQGYRGFTNRRPGGHHARG